jgi:integrase
VSKRKTWTARIFLGRDETGKQQFFWVGRFATKRERDAAITTARTERPWESKAPASLTCDEWADRYLARYERLVEKRERKVSSLGTARGSLQSFRATFGSREVGSIEPVEAEDWAQTVPPSAVPQVVAMFNYAKRMRVIAHNPFDGLGGGSGRGRADEAPPTLKELQALRDGCAALGAYGPQMRDLIDFASLTLMRPGELYELRHPDVDLVANRIHVSRRLYRGAVDVPKGGAAKTIALVPPAREILLRQATRARGDGLVFVSKQCRRLTASTVCQYWAIVRAAAGLDPSYDFYRCTKHAGVHELYRLGLSKRAIAAQAGWSERDVEAMLRVYGHADLVVLGEVDALYAGESDASVTQEAPDAL